MAAACSYPSFVRKLPCQGRASSSRRCVVLRELSWRPGEGSGASSPGGDAGSTGRTASLLPYPARINGDGPWPVAAWLDRWGRPLTSGGAAESRRGPAADT
nr:unnamed protein product [Digitaria exilis]